ncbi:MAG: trigger factor [Planctomycetota bacterium]
MTYELISSDNWKRSLKFSVPAEDVERKYTESLRQAQKLFHLPGFRPGRVPLQIIEKRLSEQLIQDTLETVQRESFEEAVKELKLEVLGRPTFTEDEAYTKGSEYKFTVEFEIEPEFELPNYKGIELTKLAAVVTDEELEAEIESRRFRSGKWQDAPERKVEKTDAVTADIVVFKEGEEVGRLEGKWFVVRENGLREFEIPNLVDLMTGVGVGDEREVITKLLSPIEGVNAEPKDDVTLKIIVSKVSVLELPELNDEFAKAQGFASLEDMKTQIRRQIEDYKKESVERELRNQMIDKLVESADFELPEQVLHLQAKSNYDRARSRYLRMGVDIENMGDYVDKFRESAMTDAKKSIKLHFLIEKIADKERIFCTESEFAREVEMMASQYQMSAAKMRKLIEEQELDDQIRADIKERKVLDFILKKAVITEVDKPIEMNIPDPEADEHESEEHVHDEHCDCGHDH